MLSPSRGFAFVCGTALLACLVACGGVTTARERVKRSNDLHKVGIAFHNYHDANRTFPPDEATFLKWAQANNPEVVPIVQSGQYTILYAPVRITEITEGASNVVIAYDNEPLGGSRVVVMADGAPQILTEAEFAGKPRLKAKKQP